MAQLTYAGATMYEFDDRTLAHLQMVIAAKLRRQEAFTLSWAIEAGAGSGRVSLWIAPWVPLQFHFRSSQHERLNRAWVEVMSNSANSPQGLELMTEAEAEARLREEQAVSA